jgi:hypothetical protein
MPHPTDWLHRARWGVFWHFLADSASATAPTHLDPEQWNRRVEAVQVERLAARVAETGAGYFVLTLGQNSGYYCSPNTRYDALVPHRPSRLSRRDLPAELGAALGRHGLRLMVYLPSGAPREDAVAVAALEWRNGPHRNAAFQRRWEAVIAEWSRRWGAGVSGWWFDGCYWPEEMYPAAAPAEEPGFPSFAAAARAGNPEALVAFNPGVKYPVVSLTAAEDYTAGEIDDPWRPELEPPPGRWLQGRQYHLLCYLGAAWGAGEPRFASPRIAQWSRRQCAAGAAVSWDVPIREDGTVPEAFLRQLRAIGEAVRAA